jgi:ribosomal protein L21E
MDDEHTFEIGDKVVVLPSKFRDSEQNSLQDKFIGKTGTVILYTLSRDSYKVNFTFKDHEFPLWFFRYRLKHEVKLTPETDAVFRDILRDV